MHARSAEVGLYPTLGEAAPMATLRVNLFLSGQNQTSVYQLETIGLVQLGINPANISINKTWHLRQRAKSPC